MKCERIHPLFSELMDEQLSGDLEAAAKQHLDLCEGCRAELDSFVQATRALQSLTPPESSSEYVQNIMATLDGAALAASVNEVEHAPSESPVLRRVAAHALSTLVGAATALLCLRILFPDVEQSVPAQQATPLVQTQVIEVPAALRLVQGQGSLVRAGRTEPISGDRTLLFEPGDVYRIPDGADVTLALGDAGILRIIAATAARPEPEIVEKVVEKTRVVRRGPLLAFELDNEAVARAADQVSRSIDSMRSSLRLVGQGREPAEPVEQERSVAPEPAIRTAEPAREPTPIVPPVVIHRVGGQLILETSGQPFEVLPALIGFLDDSEPALVDMVLDRLETIRQELDVDPALAGTLALDPEEAPKQGALDQFTSFFSKSEGPPQSERQLEAQRWNLWWERNAVRILEAETYGTF